MKTTLESIGTLALTLGNLTFTTPLAADTPHQVTYHTAHVAELNVFYREAGDPARPTVVLLHGFPSASHRYRDLIPKLAGNYQVLAPDFPGYGYSDQPSVTEFAYTYHHLAAVRFEPPRLSGSFALPMSLKLYGLNLERNDGKKRCYFIQMLCLRHVIDNHLPT